MNLKIDHKLKLRFTLKLKEIGYAFGIIEKPVSRKILDWLTKDRF